MTTTAVRKIVKIDASKCNGCGLCVPSCAEGAIRIIDGKARLVAENLCDGLGNCLGTCPQGAITIEERPAEAFDERAVRAAASRHDANDRCPGMKVRMLRQDSAIQAGACAETGKAEPSQLRHWPVQLALLPVSGPMWAGADVLLAADCVAVAMPDFHRRLLAGKTVALACPKLDDAAGYIQKLAKIFAANDIRSVTVAHMEVPCCFGLSKIVRAALEQAGRTDISVHEVTIGIDGRVQK